MSAARMLIRFIWNADTPVNSAARLASGVGAFSRTLAGTLGNVWKCRGRFTSSTAFHSGPHTGCHIGSMSQEHETAQPHPGHAIDFLDRRVDVAVRQAGEADLAIRIVPAKIDEPVVVDAEHFLRGLVVVQPCGCAEDAEDDLR